MKKFFVCFGLIFFQSLYFFGQKFAGKTDALHYSIHLEIKDFENETIKGNTSIQIKINEEKTQCIELQLLGMKIDSVFMFQQKNTDFSYDGELLKIPLATKKRPVCTQIQVYYHGKPQKDLQWGGCHFAHERAFNIGVGMDADPHAFGRVWFPCFDNFEDKATYDIAITTRKEHTAVCSGILQKKETNPDGSTTFRWTLKQPVSTYLVSFAVGEYIAVKDNYSSLAPASRKDIPIELYVYPEDTTAVKKSFKNLKKALLEFEEKYGAYIWDRVGYVEVPFTSGAMEHVCNIAYPDYAIDGTLQRETLMAHELSHHWFGNLVTCKSAQDMWLNEGMATFSEALFKEAVYGKKAYKEYVRKNHAEVLALAHVYDKGYLPVFGIPHRNTYGFTVYFKGADVARTLRGYLGDTLFFDALTAYLEKFAYKTASTRDFLEFLSAHTQTDLNHFFDTWVYIKGFPHFSIAERKLEKVGEKTWQVNVRLKQRLKEREFYGFANRIELNFVDAELQLHHRTVSLTGEEETFSLVLPFEPKQIWIDAEEKIADATVDNYQIISQKGRYDFPYTDFSCEVKNIKQKAIIQVVKNYISPENQIPKGYICASERYREVHFFAQDKFQATGIFYADADEDGLDTEFKNMCLLYRKDALSDFRPIAAKKEKSDAYSGFFFVKNLQPGEYIFAKKED